MNVITIILAGGAGSRWNNYLEIPKHLVTINDEILLHRTVRQIKDHCSKIYIVAPDSDHYKIKGTELYVPTTNIENKFLSSKELWSKTGRTVVLFGDVFYTDQAINTIYSYPCKRWKVFGRYGISRFTKKRYGELFAQSFWPEHLPKHEAALLYIKDLKEKGIIKRAIGWEHYRAMSGATGAKVSRHVLYEPTFVEINDWTDDFDTPEEYERFKRLYTN